MEKTVEMLKFGKGYYVITRVFDHASERKYFKTKTAATAEYKNYLKAGYTKA